MLCVTFILIPHIDLLQSRDAAMCTHPADDSSFKKKDRQIAGYEGIQ